MWYSMAKIQQSYNLSDRLIRAIMDMRVVGSHNDEVQELLASGAKVNQLHGMLLPLHCACMVKDVYCLRMLLERGAEVNAIDGYGRAALHYAAEKSVECLAELLQCGAIPDIPDANNDTPLHWASFKNNPDCVRELIESGADINYMDYNNDTALSWAAQKGNLETIKVLLSYNAKVDVKNYNNLYPFERAAGIVALGLNTNKDDACLNVLIEAMGQFDIRNSEGELPNYLNRDNKLGELFSSYCCQPRSLQSQVRFTIRKALGPCYLPETVPKLPIPDRIQEYLLLLKDES